MPRLLPVIALAAAFSVFASPCLAADAGPEDAAPQRQVDVGLDPGHSDADVGAAGGGLREANLTLAVALRVRDLLRHEGLTVALSREDNRPLTDMSDPDLTERTRIEQEARIAAVGNVRAYVSIHFNGFGNPQVLGAESYFNGDNHGDESRELAASIQESLLAEVGAAGYSLPDRGVKEDLAAGKPYGHFFSLRGPVPSALVESMFLTNPEEAALLHDDAMLDAIARGIAAGMEGYLASHL